jgi:hypothetical protein
MHTHPCRPLPQKPRAPVPVFALRASPCTPVDTCSSAATLRRMLIWSRLGASPFGTSGGHLPMCPVPLGTWGLRRPSDLYGSAAMIPSSTASPTPRAPCCRECAMARPSGGGASWSPTGRLWMCYGLTFLLEPLDSRVFFLPTPMYATI